MSGIAITFPSSPSEGQSHLAQNGFTYIYDSQKNRWKRGGEFVRAPKVLTVAGTAVTTTGAGIATGPTGSLIYVVPGTVNPSGEVGVDSFKAYRTTGSYPNYTEIQVSISSAFSSVAYAATFADTTHTIPSSVLSGDTTYYLRARQFVGSNASAAGVGAISGYSANPVKFTTASVFIDTPTIVSIAGTTQFPVYQIGYASTTLPATVTYTGGGLGNLEKVEWRVTGPRNPDSTGDTALAEVGIGTFSSATLANALVLAMPFSGATGVGITNDVNGAIRTASSASAGTTKTVTAVGSATTVSVGIATTTAHFYPSAAYFSGSATNDHISIPNVSLGENTENFTFETWLYTNDTVWMLYGGSTFGALGIGYNVDSSTQGLGVWSQGVAPDTTSGVQIPYNTWNHIAVCRRSSIISFFVNGVRVYSANNSVNYPTNSTAYIGRDRLTTAGFYYIGYLQDLKIYKGLAKYQENFTPPLPTYGTISYTTRTIGSVGIATTAFFKSTGDIPTAEVCSRNVSASVTNNGTTDYTFSGDISGNDPSITVYRGDVITLSINASGHPFWIQTVSGAYSSGNVVTQNITNNGTQSGTITWTPQTAGTYYYVCQNHSAMGGSITVSEPADSLVLAMPMNRTFGFQDINVAVRGLTSGASAGTAKTVGLGTTSTANAPSHPIISSTESKWYDGAAYFDGGDYASITTPSTDLINWYSTPYTIECWIYPTAFTQSTNGGGTVASNSSTTDGSEYWGFGPNSSGLLKLYYFNGGLQNINSTKTLSLNNWQHIAMVQSGGTVTFYADGVNVGGGAYSGSPQSGSEIPFLIGRSTSTGLFNGYIQDLRVYKGLAKYTSSFSPSQPICGFTTDLAIQTGFTTTTATGSLLSSVVGLGSTSTLSFGADQNLVGVTSITSSSGITTLPDPYAQNLVLALPLANITGVGNSFTNDRNTQIRTASITGAGVTAGTTKTITNTGVTTVSLGSTSKWYGNAAYFDGGDHLQITPRTDFQPTGNTPFTFEAWIYPTTSNSTIFGTYINTGSIGAGGERGFLFILNSSSQITVPMRQSFSEGNVIPTTTTSISLNTWTHLSIQIGAQTDIYFNGVLQSTTVSYFGTTSSADGTRNPITSYHASAVTFLGANNGTGTPTSFFTGYMQDVKIYNGLRKYTANFTPPPPMFGDYTRSTPNKIVFTPGSDYALEARNTATGGIVTSTYSATRQWGTKPKGGIYDPFASNLVLAIPGNNTTTQYDVSGQIRLETPTSSYSSGQTVTSPSGSTYTNKSVTNPGSSAVTFITTQSKYYGYSMYFAGTGNLSTYLSIADSSDFDFQNDWTIECWFYMTRAIGTQEALCASASDYKRPSMFRLTNGKMGYFVSSDGSNWDILIGDGSATGQGTITVPSNQWNHVAFQRRGTTYTGYINGVIDLNKTVAGTPFNAAEAYTIGRWGQSYGYQGYIQDFRIYTTAKYTSNFTPPNQIYVA